MNRLLIALVAIALAGAVTAQTPAPATIADPQDAAAARRAASRQNVQKATEDKGHTQRAGEAAAKAGGTGMSDEAKAARRAASSQNVKKTTEDKGHTQRAGEAAAKASGTGMSDDATAARRAASAESVKKTTEDKGHTQRAGEQAAKVREEQKAPPK